MIGDDCDRRRVAFLLGEAAALGLIVAAIVAAILAP